MTSDQNPCEKRKLTEEFNTKLHATELVENMTYLQHQGSYHNTIYTPTATHKNTTGFVDPLYPLPSAPFQTW